MEEKTKLPVRKKIRMENFDYSSAVAYFITICTKDRKPLFWKNDCLKSARANGVYPHLTEIGECVNTEINNIDSHYDNVIVDKYLHYAGPHSFDNIFIDRGRWSVADRPNNFEGYETI